MAGFYCWFDYPNTEILDRYHCSHNALVSLSSAARRNVLHGKWTYEVGLYQVGLYETVLLQPDHLH
ncbi:hypothetical protein DBV39_15675 [Orrella marina]|uniref:Uncharacterized protein n=1 Tax=Orrella marina TaxID=2163011 RepID=A0A2R4XMI5_9BURK|nr:hypothetical protein DBV39_15675 [Orrella marina]